MHAAHLTSLLCALHCAASTAGYMSATAVWVANMLNACCLTVKCELLITGVLANYRMWEAAAGASTPP